MRPVRAVGAPDLRPLQQGAQHAGHALHVPHVLGERWGPARQSQPLSCGCRVEAGHSWAAGLLRVESRMECQSDISRLQPGCKKPACPNGPCLNLLPSPLSWPWSVDEVWHSLNTANQVAVRLNDLRKASLWLTVSRLCCHLVYRSWTAEKRAATHADAHKISLDHVMGIVCKPISGSHILSRPDGPASRVLCADAG